MSRSRRKARHISRVVFPFPALPQPLRRHEIHFIFLSSALFRSFRFPLFHLTWVAPQYTQI